ncbi:MAG TPA: hypothetical protein VF779_18250 [Pyrinomonadaceae bacterium]
MNEKSIKLAAQKAVNDLELECEVKEICRSPSGDEWCVQFSGNYSQFCDKFQDQFDKDNSPLVIREKVKRHLLKQVDKIRRSTGKTRRPKAKDDAQTEGASGILGAPLKMIGDVLGGATQVAGDIIDRASSVADAARKTVANMDSEIVPTLKVEMSAASNTEVKKPRRKPSTRTIIKPKKAQTKRAAKTARKPSTRAGKQAKKVIPASKKSGSKAKKASAKKSKKR